MILIEKIINNHRLTARQWGYDLHVLQPSACLEAQAAFWRQLPTFRPYERRGGGKKGKGKGVKIGETKYTYIADGEIRVCDRLTNQPCRLPWPLRLTSLRWCRTDVCQRMGMKP